MINYVNKHNLPESVVRVLQHDEYDDHDAFASVTSLIDSPYIWKMRKMYLKDPDVKIDIEVANLFNPMFGTAVHALLDKACSHVPGMEVEKRLFTEIAGKTVSGKADLYQDGIITDYKVTSKYAVRYNKYKPEWEDQLNSLAYLFEKNGYEVKGLQIVAILKDLLPQDKFSNEFPPIHIKTITIPKWSLQEQGLYLEKRVRLFDAYDKNDVTSHCSPTERWQTATQYAVKKRESKTAFRLLNDMESARALAQEKGMIVELRPGTDKRCEGYCELTGVCSYAIERGYNIQQEH